MTDETRDNLPLYPADSAFVLQFQRGCGSAASKCVGVVEHISSGRAKQFTSVAELVTFVQSTITKAQSEAPPSS